MQSIEHDRYRPADRAGFFVEQGTTMLTTNAHRQFTQEVEQRDRDIIALFDVALPDHIPVGQVAFYLYNQIIKSYTPALSRNLARSAR